MPYGKNKPKKMGCSGGGPNMYKMGSKEKNTPMNFSDKAMKYMKNMPAMYGKPKMTEGDPEKKKLAAKKRTGGGYAYDSQGRRIAEGTKEYVDRKKKEFIHKFGQTAYNLRVAKSRLKDIKPTGRTKPEVDRYQAERKKAQARVSMLEAKLAKEKLKK